MVGIVIVRSDHGASSRERARLIALCIGLVIAAELLNSALEALIDHLHPEIHPAIGRAKDVLAGMVLVLSITAAVVGALAVADRFF